MKSILAVALLLLFSALAFGQSGGSIGGTVVDKTQGVVITATITATNVETGIVTKTTTNNTGRYTFPNLQNGTYNIVVEAPGLQQTSRTDVRLRTGDTLNLPFELAVAGLSTEVTVEATVESMTLDQGTSTGSVMQEDMVTALPTFTNDALELINTMGGVVKPQSSTFGGDYDVFTQGETTFAGVRASNINIMRDGISVNEIRHDSGIATPSKMNTELVGEMKMILSPVDAELGRGAGQVIMTTRSGANTFHGSAVWNIQNTALDANEWANKDQTPIIKPNWRNLNNYTLSLGGPIIKNKTFFFVTWDHQIARERADQYTTVLTPCARKGIYRYLENVVSLPSDGMNSTAVRSYSTSNIPGTDIDGDGAVNTFVAASSRPGVHEDGRPWTEAFNYPGNTNLTVNVPTNADQVIVDGGGILVNNPNGTRSVSFANQSATSRLAYYSVIGGLDEATRNALGGNNTAYASANSWVYNGCPDNGNINFNPQTANYTHAWDMWRTAYDQSPFVSGFTALMPEVNSYAQVGDGLNTAAHQWTRTVKGRDTVYGILTDGNRKAITTKIDHNINTAHRLSGTYSYESDQSQDTGTLPTWPNGYGGSIDRTPQTFTVALTSTLKPTVLNEFRVGLSRTRSYAQNPLSNSDMRAIMDSLLPTSGAGWNYHDAILASPGGAFPGSYGHIWGGASVTPTWGGVDPRWTFADTVTWMRGAHSFKGGFEFRRSQSWQEGNSSFSSAGAVPVVNGGSVANSLSPQGKNATSGNGPFTGQYGESWVGLSTVDSNDIADDNYGNSGIFPTAYSLMNYLSGSVANISQYFFTVDPKNPRWNDPSRSDEIYYTTDIRNRELSFFFKDDWKISRDLTLNLGARWEYYGAPWIESGLAAGVLGGIDGLYGISAGHNGGAWMPDLATLQNQAAGGYDYVNEGTKQIFISKNSGQYSDIPVFNRDTNNWAPHVGFAWQLPWFGKGKTTMRGGYSISYTTVSNFGTYGTMLAHQPGQEFNRTYTAQSGCFGQSTGECYMDFAHLNQYLPLSMTPTGRLALGDPNRVINNQFPETGVTIFDPNIRNPYIQNLSLSVTRQLGNALTLDVRYVGTLSRKTVGSLDLNTINYVNNGLFSDLEKLRARYGDLKSPIDYPFLNSGIIPYYGDGVSEISSLYAGSGVPTQAGLKLSGAEQVLYQYWGTIARGNFSSVASSLRTANFAANLRTNNDPETGAPYRPTVREDEGSGQVLRAGHAPDNLLRANPQYGNATVTRNQGRSNYHSMQVQLTMRPVRGLSFQTTYTWSRNLARGSVLDYNDPNWEMEYTLSGQHRSHTLNSYGTYELPFGPNGFFFRNSSGVVKKAIEGWQLSWIAALSSGSPMTLTGINTTWNANRAVQVGPFDPKDVAVRWTPAVGTTAARGTYFNKNYTWVTDPQCLSPLVDQTWVNPFAPGQTLAAACATMGNVFGGVATGLQALAERDADGNDTIIFRNAVPGEIGNARGNMLTGPGTWTLDMTMAKSIEFMEGKRIELRIDAQNILNHAQPSFGPSDAAMNGARSAGVANPNVYLNDSFGGQFPFGYLNTKAGHRTFQAKLRLSF
jgi:hypothetical protein